MVETAFDPFGAAHEKRKKALVACGCLCSVVAYGCLYRYRYRYRYRNRYKYKWRYRHRSLYRFLTSILKTLLLGFFAGIIRF